MFCMDFRLDGKVVLVTGASRGIGRETARLLAACGATVIVNYNRGKEDAERLCAELGNGSIAIKADVGNAAEVKAMFDAIRQTFSRLDILVNNAGILKEGLLLMTRQEDYDQVLNTNLKGTFLCVQHAAKMMMKQRSGKIINVSSIMGTNGSAAYAHYSASKAGVIGLTKSAAKELGRYGITVNAVAPGFIETDMTSGIKPEAKAAIGANISLGRTGKADDVAKVILFLASPLSDYVSGQVIGVDGCQVM